MIISMRRPLREGEDKPASHSSLSRNTEKKRLSYNMVITILGRYTETLLVLSSNITSEKLELYRAEFNTPK